MRRIRLNESQFNRLVSKCVKRCLNEGLEPNIRWKDKQYSNGEIEEKAILCVNNEKVGEVLWDGDYQIWDGYCYVGHNEKFFNGNKDKNVVMRDIENFVRKNIKQVLDGVSYQAQRKESYRRAYED